MFTIKQVIERKTADGMTAKLITMDQGSNVRSYFKDVINDDDTVDEVYTVSYDTPSGSVVSITAGTIYVMNEIGKTVEIFRLDRPQMINE